MKLEKKSNLHKVYVYIFHGSPSLVDSGVRKTQPKKIQPRKLNTFVPQQNLTHFYTENAIFSAMYRKQHKNSTQTSQHTWYTLGMPHLIN